MVAPGARRALPAVPGAPRRPQLIDPCAGSRGPRAILHPHQRLRDQHQLLGACSPAPSCAWCSRCSPSARSPPAGTPPCAGWRPRKAREVGQAADVELNVKKAYYGLKAGARGAGDAERGHGAAATTPRSRSTGDLAKGTGNVTQTDKLRMRTVRAEVDIRLLEAQKLADDARAGLRALLGPEAPADLDVDDEPLDAARTSPSGRWPTTRSRPGCPAPRCGRSTTWWPASARWPISSAASSTPTWC